jgi:phosphoglycolate phosphatase
MIETLILDLDGPLLETSVRHHACYAEILGGLGFEALELDAYWTLKRRKAPLAVQLSATGAAQVEAEFRQRWTAQIEREDVLALDTVQPGAARVIEQWASEGFRLVLVTLRQHADRALEQLRNVGLHGYWESILVCSHEAGVLSKVNAVRAHRPFILGDTSLWIGDSEIDVQAARVFGCQVCAVECGVRSRAFLKSESPDRIVADLNEISSLLATQSGQDAARF